ncbi:hypothetical protein [Cacatuid alphaherpesvirus 2]|uniref:Small capsomere-interacting protein n=1 Tax=Cacatuid alphaherpesvirus 2 TaxID=2604840 RepID=A0A5B9R4V1_9ALPH|nr:hypothetical protein QKT46_gp33 [Cacatuid alphaherpesvirus 2]QEG54110.1 hypothetical protein [Cacatuid alphaherpesvirus 2]
MNSAKSNPGPSSATDGSARGFLVDFLRTPPKDHTPEKMRALTTVNLNDLIEVVKALRADLPKGDPIRGFLRTNTTLALSLINRAPRLRDALDVGPVSSKLTGPAGLWQFGVRQLNRPRLRQPIKP